MSGDKPGWLNPLTLNLEKGGYLYNETDYVVNEAWRTYVCHKSSESFRSGRFYEGTIVEVEHLDFKGLVGGIDHLGYFWRLDCDYRRILNLRYAFDPLIILSLHSH